MQIWSSGGGTQSTAIAVLICQGRLPKPDRAVIADTGRETSATWEYLDHVVSPALSRVGIAIERLPCRTLPALFNSEGTLLLPVFATGAAKFSNFCSSYWKRDKVKAWALREGLTPATNWIGFSTNEMNRVSAQRAANWQLRYPLIFDVPMSRLDCLRLVLDYGWPRPPRSSCWMCPNRTNSEWRHLREKQPGEFAMAVALEREMRAIKPDVFLHTSRVPLDQAPLGDEDNPQGVLGCGSGDCFV